MRRDEMFRESDDLKTKQKRQKRDTAGEDLSRSRGSNTTLCGGYFIRATLLFVVIILTAKPECLLRNMAAESIKAQSSASIFGGMKITQTFT
jgi:hypothetical protein